MFFYVLNNIGKKRNIKLLYYFWTEQKNYKNKQENLFILKNNEL